MGNTRNTGYLQNIVQYDASNNITLPARLAVTGTVSINNTTPYDTTQFSLDVNGGLIVKNINKTAQFVLINSNPATGGNNAFVVHTVGGTSGSSYADIQGYYGTSVAGSTVIRLNPQGGNVLVGSLAGTGTRVVVASSTGVLSTQAAQTIGDLNGVPTSRTITINGTTQDLSADRTFTINSMVYPGAGIAVSTGTAWGTSLTDNSANWNTAYGWGNHAGLYSLLNHTHTFASLTSIPTTLVGYGITDAATSAQGTSADTAYGWGNHASGGYVTLTGTQTISGVKTFSTYQLMDVAILIKHGSNTSTSGYTGIGSVASGLTINLGIGTTGSLLFNTSASYSYTFPAASGTIALTSDLSTYATQTYVGTQIANLVASSPAALDTLNELAAALGNDAAFSTTVSTALGNRLRIDTASQGLTGTQQGYGRTNLGLGSLSTLSSIGDAYITDLAYSKLTGVPSTFAPSAHTHDDRYYTETEIGNFFSGASAITGYNKTNWDTAYGWGNHASGGYLTTASAASTYVSLSGSYANPSWITSLAYSKITGVPAFITSYTETDTLASVTGRGASTSTAISINNTLTVTNARIIARTGGVNTYGIFSGYDNSNHLIVFRAMIGGTDTSPTFTAGHQTCLVEYAEANDTTGWFFKTAQTGNYAEVARITRTGITWNGNTVIHSGNIGSQSVSYAATAGSAPNSTNQNPAYLVTPGEGNGLKFWNSDNYKISMGASSVYQYGTVTDYSIKTQMNAGDAGRGFTWGRIDIVPIASLNATSGNMQIAGSFTTTNINAPSGYVSNGNPWGTSNSAYFPNGITTAGGTNWIYGNSYIGNAPSNGSGVLINASGSSYFRSSNASGTWGFAGQFVDRSNAANNYVPWSFENEYGNHSWGIVARFHIQGTASDRPSIQFSSGFTNNRWSVGYCYFDDNFRITQNQAYRTDGSAVSDGWGTERFRINTDGTTYCFSSFTASGDVTAYSDIRVKTNIETVTNAVEKIQSIRGVTFTRTDTEDKERKHLGVVAQEVLDILPEVISETDKGLYTVAYGNMAGLFIEAIKEQQTQIESQKSEIDELKDLVQQLINR